MGNPRIAALRSPHSSPEPRCKMISVFPSYTVPGFIAAAIVLIPLPRQIRVGNVATIAMSLWLFQHCLAASINTIVWRGNVIDVAPIWCDITCAFRDGVVIALPACTVCISKHLEFISSRRAITTENLKLRRRIFDMAMCLGLPALWIFIGYCFRVCRYNIVEDFGCYSNAEISNAYMIVFVAPTLALSIVTLVYGTIALYRLFSDHRANMKILTPHLRSRGDALSGAQYYRLMIMSMMIGVWGVVWISAEIPALVAEGISPLPSWGAIHAYNHVPFHYPTALMTPEAHHNFLLFWWGIPGAAYLYLMLFGTSGDVLAEYPKMWLWVRTKVLRLPPPVRSQVTTMSTWNVARSGTAVTRSLPIHIDTTVVLDDLESKGD